MPHRAGRARGRAPDDCARLGRVAARRGAADGRATGGERLLTKLCEFRGSLAAIPDALSGRMPLAYPHFVQLLVDSLLALAPVALHAKVGAWSIYLAGVLTLFYKGLLEMSKSFLDPFGNENFLEENIQIDVLLGESNSRATGRPRPPRCRSISAPAPRFESGRAAQAHPAQPVESKGRVFFFTPADAPVHVALVTTARLRRRTSGRACTKTLPSPVRWQRSASSR